MTNNQGVQPKAASVEEPSRCVVFFSGGVMSWAAGKRAVERFGPTNTTLLFTDTLIEDADLYRFLEEAATNIGAPLVRLSEGRSVWEVFADKKRIGNQRAAPCTEMLKQKPAERWLKANVTPEDTALVFGIHWEEGHRHASEKDGVKRGVANRYGEMGYPHVWSPMCDSPWMSQADIHIWLKSEGLRRPRLYDLGFAHNNCGGFCVKAGEGHFAHLLRVLPEVYAQHEASEEAFNAARPDNRRQTVLAPKQMVGLDEKGLPKLIRVPMTMAEFREYATTGGHVEMFDVGGCGCFVEGAA